MPVYAPHYPSPPVKQALSDLSHHLTPHVFRNNKRKVAARQDFADVHRSIAVRQYEYLAAPRGNYVQARGAWFRELAPCRAHLLGAANMEARINFSDIAIHSLTQHREFYAGPIFLVTIEPVRYTLPLEVASQVDLHGLKQTVRQTLAGLSFIGMIDFSLLKSWGRAGIPRWNNHVGAHAHCLVFGATRKEVDEAIARMGHNFRGVTGKCAAHVKEIPARELEGYFRYSLKAPLFEYQVRTGARMRWNAKTGETKWLPNIDSHPLRSGDQLRMAAVVHEMYLDELLFGQGGGTALVREIVSEARGPIRVMNLRAINQGRNRSNIISTTCTISPSERSPLSKLVTSPRRRFSPLRVRRWLDELETKAPKRHVATLCNLNDL